MPRHSPLPITGPDEPITTTSIGTLALFIPFLVVFILVLLTGHTPAQFAGATLLLVVPFAILAMRRRARANR